MEMFFSNYSEISTPYLFHGSDSSSSSSSSDYVNSPESISSTHTNTTTTVFSSSDGEDVIILASDCPKKRAGRKKFKETRHPVYRGVRKRNNDKWVCELREPNKKTRIWLGTYSNPEMAARAHDVAAIALRGKSACLNFADSVWRLPVPVSSDAKDIRKAAAEAAKAFADDEQQQMQQSEVEEVTSRNKCIKKILSAPEKVFYIDEEEEFEMPRLLADMAEGLLLSPPCYSMGKGFINWDDQVEYNTEVSLWNY